MMVVAVFETRNHTVTVQQGYIWWRLWFPGEFRMVPLIRVICAVVWGIGWWLVLTHSISLLS